LSDLLRKAKTISQINSDPKFSAWIEKELNGYNEKDEIPEYRKIKGELMAWNPVRGLIPVFIQEIDIQERLSTGFCYQPVGELEFLIYKATTNEQLIIPYPISLQSILYNAFGGVYGKFVMSVPAVYIIKILEVVRNKLLDKVIEISNSSDEKNITSIKELLPVFPKELIEKLPSDLKILADDFNFNYQNKRPVACMLILRRILPLAIVRKFQMLCQEKEIIRDDGDYLDTKGLLGKVKSLLKNKRIYDEIMNYKILLDASQHSYAINVQMTDAEGAAVKIRVFLEELFECTETLKGSLEEGK
jgi:hypothetical protein